MSIDPKPGGKSLVPAAPPTWGEVAPPGERALVIRFILESSVVTFPLDQIKRWEHAQGEPETLTLATDREQVLIEGRELAEIRAALDLGRLCEIRAQFNRASGQRPGPLVRRIAIEPA